MKTALHLGQTLEMRANPFEGDPATALCHTRLGGVLVTDGRIAAVGAADALCAAHPTVPRIDHGAGLILPGFVDAHAHAAQTAILARWSARLTDWLSSHTFPEEMRFADPAYAGQMAALYLDLCLDHGTTTAASFCTIHPESVRALMARAEVLGLSWVAGRVMMDRNAPAALTDSAETAYDESAALIAEWQGRGRLTYAITPRFAPTSSPAQLEAAGALWAAHPGCLMQTHLSEQTEEVAWVKALYPEAAGYLDVYDRMGLLGPGALMGHAIHLTEAEWARVAETGTALVHCPTSNTFLGSGIFAMARAQAARIPVGLATDVGGGSSFSMLRTMAAAFELGQLAGHRMHPAHLLWLATAGGARALRLGDRIGALAPGQDADFIVLDLGSTAAIRAQVARAEDVWDAVFPTIMMGDDRAIAAVYAGGQALRGQVRPGAAGGPG
ncbi:MAG: guanine deaminase [Pseudomonadota bacterium]